MALDFHTYAEQLQDDVTYGELLLHLATALIQPFLLSTCICMCMVLDVAYFLTEMI